MLYFELAICAVEAAMLAALALLLARTVLAPDRRPPSRFRTRTGEVLMGLATVIFFVSGVTKLMRLPFAAQEMAILHLTGWKYDLVAGIELTSGLLFAIRLLRPLALLFICAHCGGAIAAHLIADQDLAIVPSMMVMTLAALGAFLRYPQILWSLRDLGEARLAGPVLPWSRAAGASSADI
jgi:hypothetical protein